MRKNQTFLKCCYVVAIALFGNVSILFSQAQTADIQKTDSVVNTKEVKNRNVMLSAESSTSPRQLNIGLPFAGDILIMENDLPIVYTFWTQMPMTTWRYDNSIGRIGLMSFAEGALTFGKVGYCVTSWDRDPGNKFKGYASVYTNSFGSLTYDATLTGPIGKKGWGYMFALNETYDRGSGTNYQFTPYGNRAEFVKAGISKKYKQGYTKFVYKYASDMTIYSAYSPLTYDGNGKTSALNGFKLGSDSYVLGSGIYPIYDYNTGAAKMVSLNDDSISKTVSHTFYLTGEHRFKNKMKLNYSTMYMKSKASFNIQYPISLSVVDNDQLSPGEVYTYNGTTNPYTGSVQLVAGQTYPQVDITTSLTRIELTKKTDKHSLRGGFTYQYYHAPEKSYGGLYYQTVEKNPKLLDRYQDLSAYGMGLFPVTKDGLLPTSGVGSYKESTTNKAALYFSDDIVFNKWLNGGIGARIEHVNYTETHSPYVNQFQNNRQLVTKEFDNEWNKVFTGNVVVKATKKFGFLVDATYNEYFANYWDYPADQRDANGFPLATGLTSEAKGIQQSVFNVGGGIYWNQGDLISLVSKVTQITKNNIPTSQTGYNALGESQTVTPIIYNINTIGWTTDIISSPFKNFNVHFLLTLQNPQYKNYSYQVFGQSYNYSNNLIPDLSKVLIEFDPSYYMFNHDVRLWVSMRYFGPQNGNPTGAFKYNGWWENFGGIDYHLSRNVDLKLQVVNFLNQTGVKGALVGADQITDASSFVGRKIVAGGIRPRTIEFTASFKL